MSWYTQVSGAWFKLDPTIAPDGSVSGISAVQVDGPGPPDAGLITAGGAVGLTPSLIIEMAMKRTERRGKMLDLPNELVIVTQEFCQERRWHWRKRSLSFLTNTAISTYDLSSQAGMAGLTCERVAQEGPRLYIDQTDHLSLSPIFETRLQEDARQDDTFDRPTSYFMDGQDQFRLVKTPDASYQIRVPMWVLPDMSEQTDKITLVPPHLHHILVKGLEAHIFRFTLGEGSAKYQAATAEYTNAVIRAGLSTDFADGRVREWKSDETAVQSS